jgi:hypothetical protein
VVNYFKLSFFAGVEGVKPGIVAVSLSSAFFVELYLVSEACSATLKEKFSSRKVVDGGPF